MSENEGLLPLEGAAEVVPHGNGAAITPTAIERAEQRDGLLRKVMKLAIGATNESDYSFLGTNLWIEATGAEKIARRFGITFGRPTITKEYHEDKDSKRFYTMVCEGEIWMSDVDRIWAIGTADSNDAFLTQDHKNEADINDIRKKAWSNWEVNGVTRLLGIRGMTAADLIECNLDPSLIGKATYKSKKEGAPVDSPGASGLTVIEMRRQIGEALTQEFGDDQEAKEAKLRIVTAFSGKPETAITSVALLSGNRLEWAYKKICGGRK